eukprot:TRINITY_DN16495_c0_g1_i1.p1 TRINITY_DN16495_c0_g1~~TRINITY_DN16495_c0_g1_i1.p1  ORF type:complete len:266 (+),score=13.01 TRINITY_DN16495_c0_g1_i1:73-870(+)
MDGHGGAGGLRYRQDAVPLVFESLRVTSVGGLVVTWVVVFLLAAGLHILKHTTARVRHKAMHAALTFLGFNGTYLFMLVVMTLNAWLWLAVTTGFFAAWLGLELRRPPQQPNVLVGPLSPARPGGATDLPPDGAKDVAGVEATVPESETALSTTSPYTPYTPPPQATLSNAGLESPTVISSPNDPLSPQKSPHTPSVLSLRTATEGRGARAQGSSAVPRRKAGKKRLLEVRAESECGTGNGVEVEGAVGVPLSPVESISVVHDSL